MEKIARGHSQKANIARGEAECYISLKTYFFRIALAAVL